MFIFPSAYIVTSQFFSNTLTYNAIFHHIKYNRDLMTLPEGIYHRFTTDETDMIHAMRLFIGQPVWTPFNRPCDEHASRVKYVTDFVEEKKE